MRWLILGYLVYTETVYHGLEELGLPSLLLFVVNTSPDALNVWYTCGHLIPRGKTGHDMTRRYRATG